MTTSTTTSTATSTKATRTRKAPATKAAAPAKAAPAKAAPKKAEKPATDKKTYEATSRSGKTNRRQSSAVLVAAVDCKIAGRRSPAFGQGVVTQFYASAEAAQKAADEVNSGSVPDFSDAIVTPVKVSA